MEPLIAFVPPPNTATVSGQISYRERIAFPRDAVTEVRLTYQLPGQLPVVVAEQTLDQPLPANYQLAYNAAGIPRNVPLQVEAQVWERGRLRWEGRSPVPATLPLGNSRVDVLLVAPSRVR
jgi:putative lipoprotein